MPRSPVRRGSPAVKLNYAGNHNHGPSTSQRSWGSNLVYFVALAIIFFQVYLYMFGDDPVLAVGKMPTSTVRGSQLAQAHPSGGSSQDGSFTAQVFAGLSEEEEEGGDGEATETPSDAATEGESEVGMEEATDESEEEGEDEEEDEEEEEEEEEDEEEEEEEEEDEDEAGKEDDEDADVR